MSELFSITARSAFYVVPALYLIAFAYLVFQRKWSASRRVALSFLQYVACVVIGYMALVGVLFGFFGCALHGGCGFDSSWPASFLSITCAIYFLFRLRTILLAHSLM